MLLLQTSQNAYSYCVNEKHPISVQLFNLSKKQTKVTRATPDQPHNTTHFLCIITQLTSAKPKISNQCVKKLSTGHHLTVCKNTFNSNKTLCPHHEPASHVVLRI